MFYKQLRKKITSSLQSFHCSNYSITFKLSVAFVSVAILPMTFVTYYNLKRSVDTIKKQEYERLELIATSKKNHLDQLIEDHKLTIKQIATDSRIINFIKRTPTEQEKQTPKIQNILQTVFNSYTNLDSIYIINQQGFCIASTEISLINQNYAFREYFQQAILGKPYVSSILIGSTTGRNGLFFSYPVSSNSGKVLGVVILKITASQIQEIIKYQASSNVNTFIIEENGIVISHSHQKYIYHSLNPITSGNKIKTEIKNRYGLNKIKSLNIPKLMMIKDAKKTGHTSYYSKSKNQQKVLAYTPLKTQPWVLAVTEPEDIFLLSIRNLVQQNIIFVFITGITAIFIVFLLSRHFTKSLKALTNMTKAMEEDNYDFQNLKLYNHLIKASKSKDDMGKLINIFMKMTEEVKIRQQKMKTQIQDLCIQIDKSKKDSQVYEIIESKYFQEIKYQVKKMKKRANIRNETENDYLQSLQEKIKQQKIKLQYKNNQKLDTDNKHV